MRIGESQYPVTLFSAINHSPLSLKGTAHTSAAGFTPSNTFCSVFSGTQPRLPFCKAHSALSLMTPSPLYF